MTQVKWFGIVSLVVLVVGLVAGVFLVQRRQVLINRAQSSPVLQCDPGPDPYNSNQIVLKNNTTQTINNLEFQVFRCEYIPGRVEQYRGSYRCEDDCTGDGPACQVGVWDGDASIFGGFSVAAGETRVLTATANPCEIMQIDVQNIDLASDAFECHNVQSQYTVSPGEIFPGGIAFGISQNATGYNATTGICETAGTTPTKTPTPIPPTPTSPPVNTPTNTPTVTPTSTPQPTAPPGQPTYTPIPTTTPLVYTPSATPIPTTYVYVPTNTPIPTQPVTGSATIPILGIIGAVGLIILSLL